MCGVSLIFFLSDFFMSVSALRGRVALLFAVCEQRCEFDTLKDGSKRFAVKAIDKNKFNEFQSKRESHLSLSSEAEVLTSLHHPGIVHFEEWFETTTKLYLVMEFVSGGDLLKFILESGCFEEMQASVGRTSAVNLGSGSAFLVPFGFTFSSAVSTGIVKWRVRHVLAELRRALVCLSSRFVM